MDKENIQRASELSHDRRSNRKAGSIKGAEMTLLEILKVIEERIRIREKYETLMKYIDKWR